MPDDEPPPMSTRRYVESDRVEGTVVYDARGHRVGEVKRLIIEKVSGQVAFVIIAFEGFFGLGAENHALAWNKEGLRLAEMAYLSEGQIPEEVGHGAVL